MIVNHLYIKHISSLTKRTDRIVVVNKREIIYFCIVLNEKNSK